MSFTPGLTAGEKAMILLTGVQASNNASPAAVEPAGTPWVTLPVATTSGVAFSNAILMRGTVSSTVQCMGRVGDVTNTTDYWEQCCLRIVRTGTADQIGGEISDDELCFHRNSSGAAAGIKISVIEQFTSTNYPGMSFEGTLTRYVVWRMS